MITAALISGITGILSGAIPEVLKRWQDAADKRHELEVFKLQIEQQRLGHVYRVKEIETESESKETIALLETQKPLQAIGGWERFWNGMNASVRPMVTYMLVSFYMAYKYSLLLTLRKDTETATEAFLNLYSPDDFAFLCLVLGFWFGSRQIGKIMDKTKGKWF
jgi:hypothetical protein